MTEDEARRKMAQDLLLIERRCERLRKDGQIQPVVWSARGLRATAGDNFQKTEKVILIKLACGYEITIPAQPRTPSEYLCRACRKKTPDANPVAWHGERPVYRLEDIEVFKPGW